MKLVHISKEDLTSIELEDYIDMYLADKIWISIRKDGRMHNVCDRMNVEYPIPINPIVPESPK
jgi:hypothetical protein